jgi:hypothetical protein
VHVDGAQLEPIGPISGPALPAGTTLIGSLNFRDLSYDSRSAGTPVLKVEADVRLDGPRTAPLPGLPCEGPVRVSLAATTLEPGGARRRIGFASVLSSGLFCGMDVVAGRVRREQFHRVGMRIDFAQRTVDYLLNGKRLVTRPFLDAEATSGVLAAIRFDMRAVTGIGVDPGLYQGAFDRLSVRVVRSASGHGLPASGAAGTPGQ